jgi:LmbE family N-acetylglucosaminyl deacetylase
MTASNPPRALAVGAHPDDIEFGCGGTLAKWAAAGTDVHFLILTDGSKGTWSVDDDLDALVTTRQAEARDAATTLARATVHFGGFVDGELESDRAGREAVCRTIREVRPDVVLGHDPWKRYRLHPDHRHAGWLTVDGVVAARDPHFFPGIGGAHHRPDALWLFEADEPNHVESISGWTTTKADALLRHRSQWRSTMAIDPDGPEADVATAVTAFRDRIEDAARRTTPADPSESFRIIDDI